MNKLKLACFTLAILFGIFMFVYGEYDDSPGGQLMGLVIAIIGIVGAIKNGMKKSILIALIAVFLASNILLMFGLEEKSPANVAEIPKTDEPIIVEFPIKDSKISSPLTVTGRARGNWFFEASFPVILTNWDGLIIAEGYATAQGEWMTTDYVPFSATLEFIKPDYGDNGFLILKKDNPSGLPENDDSREMRVLF